MVAAVKIKGKDAHAHEKGKSRLYKQNIVCRGLSEGRNEESGLERLAGAERSSTRAQVSSPE